MISSQVVKTYRVEKRKVSKSIARRKVGLDVFVVLFLIVSIGLTVTVYLLSHFFCSLYSKQF